MKTLLIVDDHRMFAEGIQFLLERSGEYTIAAILGNGNEVVPFLIHNTVHILILDIDLPGQSGFEVTRSVRQLHPHTNVLGLSMLNNTQSISRMMAAGATGYCIKSAGYDELQMALRRVANGDTYLPESYYEQLRVRQNCLDYNDLTKREVEIIQLIAQGISTKQIADQLFLSTRTVETHRKNIYRKAGIHTNVELAYFARQHQLL
ncbi:LuxR C-terminal-related transcriptional regulator [Spirosoma arcticum]